MLRNTYPDRIPVMIFGPVMGRFNKAYGGGVGGYERKMRLYVHNYESDNYDMQPVYHSIRGQLRIGWFPVRLVRDLWAFWKGYRKQKPAIVHILAQYRTAITREFLVFWLARILGKKTIFEIEAGIFIRWYNKTDWLGRKMVDYCLKKADMVFCEGNIYMDFMEERIGRKGIYWPNFVLDEEIPDKPAEKLKDKKLRILFVGYAYRKKGIVEMVEACQQLASDLEIDLTIVGKEAPDIETYLNACPEVPGLTIRRLGVQGRPVVLKEFSQHDIYLYPSYHPGEGHNNSINEAMMMGLVIVCTRQGFLARIMNDEIAYFLDSPQVEDIVETIRYVEQNRDEARQKALNGHQSLRERFTASKAFADLDTYYDRLLNQDDPDAETTTVEIPDHV